jgi:hypothetical protein
LEIEVTKLIVLGLLLSVMFAAIQGQRRRSLLWIAAAIWATISLAIVVNKVRDDEREER